MDLFWPFRDHRKLIVEQPFPELWLTYLSSRVRHYPLLTTEEQSRLRGDLRIFDSEKNWEGALEFEVTDEVKVVVSALACLLTLGFKQHDYFPNVPTIIVYPTSYIANSQEMHGGVVETNMDARLGEAHGNGPIVLSWSDIVSDCENEGSGHNLVLHEFAHKLDFRDGDANGVPFLRDQAEIDQWAEVMSKEFDTLVSDVQHHRHNVLRDYGATNPAEFFAVCTECYFEKPEHLQKEKPDLYLVLSDYYGIDWAQRT
jgi:Mlc titration factor MtfA (ptsG expression regulator)